MSRLLAFVFILNSSFSSYAKTNYNLSPSQWPILALSVNNLPECLKPQTTLKTIAGEISQEVVAIVALIELGIIAPMGAIDLFYSPYKITIVSKKEFKSIFSKILDDARINADRIATKSRLGDFDAQRKYNNFLNTFDLFEDFNSLDLQHTDRKVLEKKFDAAYERIKVKLPKVVGVASKKLSDYLTRSLVKRQAISISGPLAKFIIIADVYTLTAPVVTDNCLADLRDFIGEK